LYRPNFCNNKTNDCKVKYFFLLVLGIVGLQTCPTKAFSQVNHTQSQDPIIRSVYNQTHEFTNARRGYAKVNIKKAPLAGLLYFYQNILSEAFQTSCPHYPSCSGFAKDALLQLRLIEALALSADRLSRCTPMGIKDYSETELIYLNDLIDDPVSDY
jgi:putative component of membrane protein insertase Oxa1/YidC/SpoIIIJ protein YidD